MPLSEAPRTSTMPAHLHGGHAGPAPLLELRNISKTFPGVKRSATWS